jgi:ATP-dependent helicase/nuclease subunit A
VLFKLDGGIDHILVDEAQDTAPAQWDVITALAAEFASGEGARSDVARTLFVVGDKKQSIYSFQGAAPEKFDEMREAFATRLAAVEAPFQSRELRYSFRSAPTILNLVDATCGSGRAPGTGADVLHTAFFEDKPGRVDLWPVIPKQEEVPDRDWYDPVDRPAKNDHTVLMADRVAARIEAMLAARTLITVGKDRRAVQPGDIVILLQRRKELFHLILQKCKARGLPLAGADVLKISGELAVNDLTALLRFLATPEDDLSLAAVLRSPLFGWSEDDLFRLAHGRGRAFLWETLRRRGKPEQTVTDLQDLLGQADFLRPYELLERVLTRMGGRQKLRARLGDECVEALDALLQQALSYEQSEVPSLTGFLGWLDAEEITIKRQMDARSGLIRIMTVHGAKGLESPVVILPECQKRDARSGARLVTGPGGLLAWKPSAEFTPESLQAAVDTRKAAEAEERDRLLYVAMTRAESWLIVGAAGDVGTEPTDSWYGMIEAGMRDLDAAPLTLDGGAGLQLISGDWSADTAPEAMKITRSLVLETVFETDAPSPVDGLRTRSPSDLGGAKALPGEGLSEALALARGTLVHSLLEHLPTVPAPDRPAVARRLLTGPIDPALNLDALIQEAIDTLGAQPDVFAPGTLSEVAISAAPLPDDPRPLYGVIDRLIVTPEAVTCVDFKTNMIVPETPEAVPLGLLRQMGAYAAALAPLYPGRRIIPAILWTRTASLMVLPLDLVTAALQTTGDG